MKEKFWGLKKDEVDRFIRRMEREFQFELQKLEIELITTKKENDSLYSRIADEERKQISLSINDPFWQLANSRFKSLLNMLNSQKESEMAILKESSSEKISKLQIEIKQLDEEIKSINQIIGQFLHQLSYNPKQNDETIESLNEEKNEIPFEEPEVIPKQVQELDPIEFVPKIEKVTLREESSLTKDRIIEQISSFKDQYIIGKVTGADLFNQTGKLIIANNTRITKEMVELANENGKLAELIVNMKVLGAGEE